MLTLEDLTPEIKAKIPLYKEKATKDLYSGKEYKEWKREDCKNYIQKTLDIAEVDENPIILIGNNIKEFKMLQKFADRPDFRKTLQQLFLIKNGNSAQKFITIPRVKGLEFISDQIALEVPERIEIKFEKEQPQPKDLSFAAKHDFIFLLSEYSRVYVTWYKFLKEEFNIVVDKGLDKDIDFLYENVNKASIAKVYITDEIIFVLRMPSKIIRNEEFFHAPFNEGAIQYPGEHFYYLNGRRVDNDLYESYFDKSLTFNDFVQLQNEEDKAAIITLIKENEGNEGVMKFLGAKLVDEQVIQHTPEYSETQKLYRTEQKFNWANDSKGNSNVQLAWNEMQCPSTGQTYLIETCPTFNSVIESAKWLRPKQIPFELDYKWVSAN